MIMQDCDTEAFFESALRDIDNFVEAHNSVKSSLSVNGERVSSPISHRPILSGGGEFYSRYESQPKELLGELHSCVDEVNNVRDLLRTLPRERQKDVLHVLNSEWDRSPSPYKSSSGLNGRGLYFTSNSNNSATPVALSTNNAIGIMSMANSIYPNSVSPPIHHQTMAAGGLSSTGNYHVDNQLKFFEEENQSLNNQVTVLRSQVDALQQKILQMEKNREETLPLDEKLKLLNIINAQQKKLNSEEMEKRSLFMEVNQSKDELARAKQIIAKQDLKIRALENIVKSVPSNFSQLSTLKETGGDSMNGTPAESHHPHYGNGMMQGSVGDSGKATSLNALHDDKKPPRSTHVPITTTNLVHGRGRSTSVQDTMAPSPPPGGGVLAPMTPPSQSRHAFLHHSPVGGGGTAGTQEGIPLGFNAKNNLVGSGGILYSPTWASSDLAVQQSSQFIDSSPIQNGAPMRSPHEHERYNNMKSQSSDDLLSNNRPLIYDYQDLQKYGTMPMSGGLDDSQNNRGKRGFIPSAQSQEALSNGSWNITKPPAQSVHFVRGDRLRATAGPRLDRFMPGANSLRTTTLPIPSYKEFVSYTCDHICGWLHDLQLAAYVPNARSWVRNGQQLLQATRRDLEKSLRVSNPMHLKKLQVHLGLIRQDDPSQSQKIATSFSVQKFLDDIGLLQYFPYFNEAAVDGYVLDQLTIEDLLYSLHLTNELHVISLRRGIQLMRHLHYDLTRLKRRPNEEEMKFIVSSSSSMDDYNEARLLQICLWSHHHVMEWLRVAQFPEFAANLRASGVHGALLVLEPRFTSSLLASVLNIPEEKTLLRRHLNSEFIRLLGEDIIQERENLLKLPHSLPLTVTGKQKLRKRYNFLTRKTKSHSDGEMVCPLDIDAGCTLPLSTLLLEEEDERPKSDIPLETEID